MLGQYSQSKDRGHQQTDYPSKQILTTYGQEEDDSLDLDDCPLTMPVPKSTTTNNNKFDLSEPFKLLQGYTDGCERNYICEKSEPTSAGLKI